MLFPQGESGEFHSLYLQCLFQNILFEHVDVGNDYRNIDLNKPRTLKSSDFKCWGMKQSQLQV